MAKIPKELIKLTELDCSGTNVDHIPCELINLNDLCYDGYKTDIKIIKRQKRIKNGFIKFIKLYKKYKWLKTLWKIAEYYTAKKYSPDNIIKYIDLSE
jgi:hypothetical protein